MKKTLWMLTCLFFAGATQCVIAADFLADRHGARNIACETCHTVKTPATGAKVDSKACISCHGDLDKMAERTKTKVPNPHYNHLIGTDCQECHKGHTPSVNLCGSCHFLEWKVP